MTRRTPSGPAGAPGDAAEAPSGAPGDAAEAPSGAPGPGRVLVAIDGSAPSDVAIELVAGLAWPASTAIRVVEAIDVGPGLFGGPWPALALTQSDELETALLAQAHREVESARERLEGPGRMVSGAVVSGRAASVILDEAGVMPADLVVIGSRGHGTIASMLLGSVSSEVVGHAPAPVLVARADRIQRIVLAWDGSSSAAAAVAAVRDWPILRGAEIRVVTVADVVMPWWAGFGEVGAPIGSGSTAGAIEIVDAARRAATALAADLVATLQQEGRTAVADDRAGDAATELIAAARDAHADLIVMGTHGRTGLARLALGSVADNVIRHAPCSVLVVRPTGDGEAGLPT